MLSPGRRTNSGSSLETSRSSTESPHLRRIYRVMQNIVDVTQCTKRETESKIQKQYMNILKQRACLLLNSLSILKIHTCCALNTNTLFFKIIVTHDSTTKIIEDLTKPNIIESRLQLKDKHKKYLSNNSFIFNRVHWTSSINHPPAHFKQTHTWTSNE